MVTDKTDEELWEEKCREIALSVTTVLLPLLVHDRAEPIPEHTCILTGHLYY